MIEFFVVAGLLGLSMILNALMVGWLVYQNNKVAGVEAEEVVEPVEMVSSKDRVSGFMAN